MFPQLPNLMSLSSFVRTDVALGLAASMSSVRVALSAALAESDPEAVDRRDDVRGNDVFPAVCLSICRRPFWSSMRVVRACLFE